MLQVKMCHHGLRPRGRFFGLEAPDLLLLVSVFYVTSILLKHLIVSIFFCVLLGLALRILKAGQLIGYSTNLVRYLVEPRHLIVLGTQSDPPYVRKEG